MALGFAAVIARTGLGPRLNGLLATLLLADAANVLTSVSAAVMLVDHAGQAHAWTVAHYVSDAWVVAAYLVFIGEAVDSPLVRPFRSRLARAGLWGLACLAGLVVILFQEAFWAGPPIPGNHWYFPWAIRQASEFQWAWFLTTSVLAAVAFGFAAAFHAWRRSQSPVARQRAGAYLLAFGVRDIGWFFVFGTLAFATLGGNISQDLLAVAFLVYAATVALYVPLLAYGILRSQLFDIDLKIKLTLQRGTVAGAFLAAFFVVATVASEFLTGTYGYLMGGIAAGLLLFLLAPLQRLAERVADRAMPGVRDTKEYRAVRKREVYRAAVEGALQAGNIADRGRAILARLQDELGLAAADALSIEREAAQRARAAG